MKILYKGYILFLLLILPLAFLKGQSSNMIRVVKVPVSTGQYNEMNAILVQDGIAFCSDRRTSGVVNNRTFNGDRVYSIFFAEREDTMKWGRTNIFSRDLLSIFNQGPFCFTPDRRHIYYTSEVERGNSAFKRDFKNRRGIFITDKVADGWSEPRAFEYNDPLWNLGHPYISNDGKYLFFSSDIPGGYGDSDIYMCRWENDSWTEPEKLGPEVNSQYSELYPYFSPAGELYFASDRGGGYGGLDIYYSRIKSEGWTKPVLMPEPINSEADDFSLYKEQDGESGFFTSNRGRTDDIYMFISEIIRKSECNELVYEQFCYEFKEVNSMKFDSMPFEFEWDFDDGTKLKTNIAKAEHCFKEPGMYVVKLNVTDMITGEINHNETSYLLQIERTEQAFITLPDSTYVGDTIKLDASMSYLPGWDIAEYYWNFDDGTADKGIEIKKTYLLKGAYDVQLIVSSKPDPEGNIKETCVTRTIVVEER